MKQRILSLLLALALLCAMLPRTAIPTFAATYSGSCGPNLTWRFDAGTGTLTIEGSGKMSGFDWNPQPWNAYMKDIKKVVFPDGLTSIGYCAFRGCTELTAITFPDGLTSIGDWAFYHCTGLTSVTLPDGLTSIGIYAFEGCTGLTSVTFPAGLTSIGEWAFSDCTGLTSVTLPDGLTSIGEWAFEGCTGLTAFSVATENPNFSTDANGVLFDKEKAKLILYPFGRVGSYTIPQSVTSIGDCAFFGCTGLTSVTLPDGLAEIGRYAFEGCTGLTSVTLPDGLAEIGRYAFEGCTGLTSITFPAGLISIGANAFEGCHGLTSVTLPDGLASIGEWAFAGCTALTSVTFPDGLTEIGYEAFRGCTSLSNVTLPDSVTHIHSDAFRECGSLSSVFICNPECIINQGRETLGIPEKTIIYGYSGSTAEDYANQYGYTFSSIFNCPGSWDGFSIANRLRIKTITPNHSSVGGNAQFSLVFNEEVEFGKGYIEIRNKDKDTIVGQYIVGLSNGLATIDGKTVTIDISSLNLLDGSYSATISKRAFRTTDGTYYCGLLIPNAWEFEVCSYLNQDGIMEYATKGAMWWKKTDTTKPAIPNGTDNQYAHILYRWAQNSNISGITEQDIQSILAEPMYLPVTDTNGATVLLNDRQTTVKQALEDILFFESLQPFAKTVDDDLAQVEKYTQLSGANVNPIRQETDLYEKVLSWYPQINKYLNRRSDCSPFFASAAPLAYQGLLTYFAHAGGTVYSYTKPILKANLDTALLDGSFTGLKEYAEYRDFKEAVDDIGSIVKAAQTTNKAVYTAFSENGLNTAKVVVKFGTGLLKRYFSDSDNSVLNSIITGWDDYDSAMSAGKLCACLGCSIGAFPLVIDLYNKLDSREAHMAAAFYFISDYYVQKQYLDLYNLVYADDGFPRDDFFQDIDAVVTLEEAANTDPILFNWVKYFTETISESTNRNRCRQLRFDLVNYIMLLQYAKEFNVSEAKDALVKYISAECSQTKTTELDTSCPVVVEVYKKGTDQLIATLSSEDEEIASCMYGTLYLLGEKNETKCFVLNDDAYYAKILPYDDGTMDVTVIATTADGTREGKTFNNVALMSGIGFDLDLDDLSTGLESEAGEVIERDSIVMATGIEITGKHELSVGSTTVLNASVLPVIATDQSVSWSSSDEQIACINEDGVVSAISEGEVTITASSVDGVSKKITFSVYTAAKSLSVDEKSLSMVVGESMALQAVVSPDATHSVSWSTNNMNVATVSEIGVITARTAGEAIISASVDGFSAEIQVTVYEHQLEIDLYQLDLGGNAVQIVTTNHSCTNSVKEEGYLAVYASGRLIELKKMSIGLSKDSIAIDNILLSEFVPNSTYSAVFYPIGESISKMQQTELIFVNGDYEPLDTTSSAAAELPVCKQNEIEYVEAEPGIKYTLYVLTDDSYTPTEKNIAYIARKTAETSVISFTACPHEDTYGEVCYAFLVDESDQVVQATTILSHNVLAETVLPTCTETGSKSYHCKICGETYYGVLSALGHDWSDPIYSWAEDNISVKASRACKNDLSHNEVETVNTTWTVTKEATYDEEGEITYTAVFQNTAFETQTKVVKSPRLENSDDPKPNPFADVKKSKYYYEPVLWAYYHDPQITNGTDATHFSPNATCTRAQVVTFLYAAKGKPEADWSNNPFVDVKKSKYYFKPVLWAYQNGITNGTDATHFNPNGECTRAQVVTFLWALSGKPNPAEGSNPFKDVKKSNWYYKAVLWAYQNGITRGVDDTHFGPNQTCTRGQVVTFLYALLGE